MARTIQRPDSDDLEAMKALSPKQVQLLAKSFEHEISALKIEIQKYQYALRQIVELRRGLSLTAFDETLPIGIIANNTLNMRE